MPALLRHLLALTSVFAYGDAFSGQPRTDDEQLLPAGCKAVPGSAGWPSAETWGRFNQSTGGKLLQSVAPGAVCHPGQPAYNSDQCTAVTTGWYTYDYHQRDPVSNMWQQYNNDTCLPNPGTPCSVDGYPAYVVNATTAQDVKLSLDFARKHNIRVVVKSTGHDYQGRSQAPRALSIWVRHMQGIKTHESFQPQGCNFTIETTAVTAAGGSQIGNLYDEMLKLNQTVVGGGSKSVSVGGYITGGGHSILAPRYGLAADQALEMEVVTPNGDIVVANECQNEDLFWAMRGGGGSTFGVMTSVTLATHPTPPVVGLDMALFMPINSSHVWDMVGYVLTQFPYLDSKGLSGYSVMTNNFSYPGTNVYGAGFAGSFIIQDTQDINDALDMWAPIIDHINKTWPEMVPTLLPQAYPTFQAWFDTHYDQNTAGLDMWVGSRLLDADSLTRNATASGQAFKIFDGEAFLVAGKGVQNAKPRGGSNAVNPAWRKTLAHCTNGSGFVPLNLTVRKETIDKVNERVEPLRQLAPHMGAYVNENNPEEPDWQHAFWGANYERLLKIKRTVDPSDVLWCNPCVGNERWKENGYQLCRV
ncbi:FAD-binding domain-containing protein [Hypomontagnella monticulosa]|nr:FAD-binding domain-containing protein [Hypomontagnella monticulosa]